MKQWSLLTILDFHFNEEKEFFLENLSLLLSSGMGIGAVLTSIQVELRSPKMRQALKKMLEEIEDGASLWKTLDKANLFPVQAIGLFRIGEESGRLSENLQVIAAQQQKERDFRAKITSAVSYPALILVLTLVIGLGVTWFILPRLALVFSQMKIKLPLITRVLIGAGQFLGQYGFIVVPAFAISLSLIFYFVFIFSKTKYLGQELLLKIPAISKLVREVELSRFGYILGNLLDAGLPVVAALESLQSSTSIISYKNFYKRLRDLVEEGLSFQKSFAQEKNPGRLLPGPIRQMIISGEQSGNLPATLRKVGSIFEAKTEVTTKNLSTMLEPLLLIIVWLGVVFVALAIVLPIYSLIGDFNQTGSSASSTAQPANNPDVTSGQDKTIEATQSSNSDSRSQSAPARQTPGVFVQRVEILPTTTGFLNVRAESSLQSEIIGKVTPGEVYEYKEINDGWYLIILSDTVKGWVLGDFVKTIEQ